MKKLSGLVLLNFFLLVIDRFTKLYFGFLDREIILIPNWLHITPAQNEGIAFGLYLPAALIIILGLIIILIFIWWLIKLVRKSDWWLAGFVSIVVIGAASNLWDRFQFGYVIDWINVPWYSIFNLADSYVVIGIIMIVLLQWRKDKVE